MAGERKFHCTTDIEKGKIEWNSKVVTPEKPLLKFLNLDHITCKAIMKKNQNAKNQLICKIAT